jgi:hypothetical protein
MGVSTTSKETSLLGNFIKGCTLPTSMGNIAMSITIESHWDPDGSIPADANPREEYELWQDFARTHPQDWKGTL